MHKTKLLLVAAGLVAMAGSAFAATSTMDTSNPGPGITYWVPALGMETTSPYYRDQNQDWGWTHDGVGGTITSAEISISAWDVDAAPCGIPGSCEEDLIEAFSTTLGWVALGNLAGMNNMFSFTTFVLGASWFDEIATGLAVRMNIDSTGTGFWLVSLAKSVITTEGDDPGNPNPGVIPLPAAGWMLIAGLGGLAAVRRRKKA